MNDYENTMNPDEVWDELAGYFGEEWITGFVKYISSIIEHYWKNGLNDIANVDPDIYGWCLIDILYDLKRMREFHELDSISEDRILTYTAAWIIKRKPIQMIQGKAGGKPEYLYINEKIAFILISKAAGIEDGRFKVADNYRKDAIRYLDRILYHLRFRNTSPRTLEVLVYGTKLGVLMS